MPSSARPLSADGLPAALANPIEKARSSWLSNEEILRLIKNVETAGLFVSSEAPLRPPGGSLFIVDKKACRYFRKDGHPWETKGDGKTVNETHEKLKVDNVKTLNCYYARSAEDDLKRRSYWRLDVGPGDPVYALVHYLHAEGKTGTGPQRFRMGAEVDEWEDSEEESRMLRRKQRYEGARSGGSGGGGPQHGYVHAHDQPALAAAGAPQGFNRLLQWVQVQGANQLQPGLEASLGASGAWNNGSGGGAGLEGWHGSQGSQVSVLAGHSGLSLSGLPSDFGSASQLPSPSQLIAQLTGSQGSGGSAEQAALLLGSQPNSSSALAMQLLLSQSQGQSQGAAAVGPGSQQSIELTISSIQQQLAAQQAQARAQQQQQGVQHLSQVDLLLQQARMEQARSEALRRPQAGSLFLSGQQMVAQQRAQQQQLEQQQQQGQLSHAQQLAHLARLSPDLHLAAAQGQPLGQAQLSRSQQLAAAQARIAQLDEQRQLAEAVVAQLSKGQPTSQQPQPQAQGEGEGADAGGAGGRAPGGALPPPFSLAQLAGGGAGDHVAALPRLQSLHKELSFNEDYINRALFHEVSLGIKDDANLTAHLTALLGSPDNMEAAPAGAAPAPAAAGAGAGGPQPPTLASNMSDLALLLSSPPRRGLRLTSSGIPRFASLGQDEGGLFASQLDTDIGNLPSPSTAEPSNHGAGAGNRGASGIDVGPLFVGSRPLSASGVASTAGPAAGRGLPAHSPAITATSNHTLEPSPPQLHASEPAVQADASAAAAAAAAAGGQALASPSPSRSLTFAPLASLDSKGGMSIGTLANGLARPSISRGNTADGAAGSDSTSLERSGSGTSSGRGEGGGSWGSGPLSLFRSAGGGGPARPQAGRGVSGHSPLGALNPVLAADARRSAAKEERMGAATQAGQGARFERLNLARLQRASAQEAEEGGMLVDNPNPLARLQSFMQHNAEVQLAADQEQQRSQACAVEDEATTRGLLKNMSIEEVEAVRALSSAGSAGRGGLSFSPVRNTKLPSQRSGGGSRRNSGLDIASLGPLPTLLAQTSAGVQ